VNKLTVHILILSDRVLPNILPVLDYNMKPERVVLCESDAMRRKGLGRRLQKFFDSKSIRSEFFNLGCADDFRELQKRFQELADKYNSRSAAVAVNLSGGSKLISLVAQNVFAGKKYTCFYALPHQSELVEMRGGLVHYSQLRDKINLTDYFKVHGFTVISKREKNLKLVSGSHALCRELLSDFDKYGQHVSYLGKLAAGAEDHFSLKSKADITQEERPLFDLFSRHGFISGFDDKTVTFASEDDRSFCKGIWMEDYLHQILKSISKDAGLQDFATSVEIESASGIRTELDAAFLCRNRLYIVEAKTARMHDKGTGVLCKLENLKDFAGTDVFDILVSLRGLRNFDGKIAREQGLYLVQGSEINDLENKIRSIIG